MTLLAAPGRLVWEGAPAPPVARLVERLALRWRDVDAAATLPKTMVLGPDAPRDVDVVQRWHEAHGPHARFLTIGWNGTHPDARSPVLSRQWDLEERARSTGRPVLTLRLAPLLGPDTPLWAKLRSRPSLPRAGRDVVQPVLEDQVVETLLRALTGRASWTGWYEVVGPDALSLAELMEMAARSGPRVAGGDWEPPLAVMREQRLGEPDAWLTHFGLEPLRVSDILAREFR